MIKSAKKENNELTIRAKYLWKHDASWELTMLVIFLMMKYSMNGAWGISYQTTKEN